MHSLIYTHFNLLAQIHLIYVIQIYIEVDIFLNIYFPTLNS